MLNVKDGIYSNTIVKTVKTLTGDEVKRKGNVKISFPETEDAAKSLMGADMWKWAAHGWLSYGKISAANSLLGVVSGGDKKLARAFNESLRTLTEVMDYSKIDAVAFLLKKEKFATLQARFDAMKATGEVLDCDYTVEGVPVPKWFSGQEEEEEESDES